MVKKAERSMRGLLSEWHFWMVIAYIGLAMLVVALFVVNARTARANARVAKEAAIHQAETSASAKATALGKRLKVSQCIAGRPQLAKIDRFTDGVSELAHILYENTSEVLAATVPTDSQYQVRLQNTRRIARTVPAVSGIHFHVPTIAECRRLGKP
jgi:dTDP-4-amino-4,6-dideoxygalactose transaminase